MTMLTVFALGMVVGFVVAMGMVAGIIYALVKTGMDEHGDCSD